MSVKIGKLLPDNTVRHIDIFSGGISDSTIFTLKNFYSTEKRVDALLELGNLNHIGSSPYGRCTDKYDFAHCYAAIRDNGANKKKNEALLSENKEAFAKLAGLCYLYENGKWMILIGDRCESIDFFQIIESINHRQFYNFEIYEFQKENEFSKVHTSFSNWKKLKAYADTENKTLYLFRKNRLVTVFNHPLTKKKIA
jgi:hypothetical protein